MTRFYVVDIGLAMKDPDWEVQNSRIDAEAEGKLDCVSSGTGSEFRDMQFETTSEPVALKFAEWVEELVGFKEYIPETDGEPMDLVDSYVEVYSYDDEEDYDEETTK